MRWVVVLSVLIITALAGCTVGDFKTATGDDIRTVTVARPYQEVYRSVREYAKKCYENGMFFSETKLDAEIYTDIKRAEVRIYFLGHPGRVNQFAIDIETAAPNTTTIIVRRGHRPIINSPQQLDVFVQAAQGFPPDCPP